MNYREAPPLPRAPTMIRAGGEGHSLPPARAGPSGALPPPPPRFPSMRDVRPTRKPKPAPETLMTRICTRVRAQPDPTTLFLLLTGVILMIHTLRPDALRTWLARLMLPPALTVCVAAAAIWRPTTARFKRDDNTARDDGPPPGVLPDAHALVRYGAALRVRDAAVTAAEEELRRGQIRLEVLRKEIESRLPSHNALAPPPTMEAPVTTDRPTTPLAPRSASNPFMTFAGHRSDSPGRVPKATSFRA